MRRGKIKLDVFGLSINVYKPECDKDYDDLEIIFGPLMGNTAMSNVGTGEDNGLILNCILMQPIPTTWGHEATHLAMYIHESTDIKISSDNHESLAYLIGYISAKLYEMWEEFDKERPETIPYNESTE